MSFYLLPTEVIAQIFALLPKADLRRCNLTSKRFREHAANEIWKSVVLTDCKEDWTINENITAAWRAQWKAEGLFYGYTLLDNDDHCDRPMIKILYILASNPDIAARVQTVTHRCHLPLPAIFQELPYMCFTSQTLSSNAKTLALLHLAIKNMINVRTLRIILGHFSITAVLLRGFLNPRRTANTAIRRLWLESCYIDSLLWRDLMAPLQSDDSDSQQSTFSPLGLHQLESLRIRRVRMCDPPARSNAFALSRAGRPTKCHDGRGGLYSTTMHTIDHEKICLPNNLEVRSRAGQSRHFDSSLYGKLSEVDRFLDSKYTIEEDLYHDLEELNYHSDITQIDSANESKIRRRFPTTGLIAAHHLMSQAAASLTSLNLDWVIFRQDLDVRLGWDPMWIYYHASELLHDLSHLRFPHLRAFQFRNACAKQTVLPEHVNLLHPSHLLPHQATSSLRIKSPDFVSFMEAHPRLECLAWPMDHFFSDTRLDKDDDERAAAIIGTLAQKLISLRIDADYSMHGEPFTDNDTSPEGKRTCRRRRRFIGHFASRLTKLRHLKMEGGIPKDEQRQLLLALHRCPLEKVVVIGLSSPTGNSWGTDGHDLAEIEHMGLQYHGLLEGEDKEAMIAAMTTPLEPPTASLGEYRPTFGTSPQVPLLYTVANCFANTITELKFCGYNGSPVLHTPTEITPALLCHLKHFHRLRRLTMSIWMLTFFDYDMKDRDVIDYWLENQALGTVPMTFSEENTPDENVQSAHDIVTTPQANDPNAPQSHAPPQSWTQIDPVQHPHDPFQPSDSNSPHPSDFSLPAATAELISDENWLTSRTSQLETWLEEKCHPRAISQGVHDLLAPYLSPTAKARASLVPGQSGVRIKASFCLEAERSDIFDFHVWVSNRGLEGWSGPREEELWGRWWDKLEGRGWFERVGI